MRHLLIALAVLLLSSQFAGADSSSLTPDEAIPVATQAQLSEEEWAERSMWAETEHPYCTAVPESDDAAPVVCYSGEFSVPDGDRISIHFRTLRLADGDYFEVTSPSSNLTMRFYADRLHAREDVWLPPLDGQTLTLTLYSLGRAEAFGFEIDAVASVDVANMRDICGDDGRLDVRCYDEASLVRQCSEPVVFVSVIGVGSGTGFLCSPSGHILTNEHVVSNATQAANTWILFQYEHDSCGSQTQVYAAEAYGLEFVTSSSDLIYDFALLKLPRESIEGIVEEYGYLELSDEEADVGDPIFVPQHGGANPKTVSADGAYISNTWVAFGNDYGHQADTEPGSSGSPVVDAVSGKVVGLHHRGFCASWPVNENWAVKSVHILPLVSNYINLPGWTTGVSPLFGAHTSPVQFSWLPAVAAAGYEMQVDDNEDFASPITQSVGGTISTLALSPGTYYWRVRSQNSHGDGDWSWAWQFEVEETASGIAATLSLSPSSATPGQAVTASGSAIYDNGYPVSDGTVEIITSEDSWTASLDAAGHYSCQIYAPSSSGNVAAYVGDGLLTGSAQAYLTIQGGSSGDNFDYDRSTMCQDVQGVDEDYAPVGETHWFRASDEKYVCWTKTDDVYVPLRFKKVWYKPDGELHDTTYSDWSDDPQDFGYDYWYSWMSWDSWLLNGYSNMDWEGRSTVDVYIREEGESYDFFETQYFIISYDYKEHRMCSDVSESTSDPIGETNTFTQTDSRAVTWSRYADVSEGIEVKTTFVEPNGSVYSDSLYTVEDPGVGYYFEWVKQWTWINIDGHQAADKCGEWEVYKYEEDPWGGWDLLYQDSFVILESPSVSPSGTVTVQPSSPLEGTQFQIMCDVSDNTYIEKVTLYWNDGTLHYETHDGLFSSSHSWTKTIGPYAEGQIVDCYARVWDTSGNQFETPHRVVTVLDSDLWGPEISDVSIAEYAGNGDGLIQDAEQVMVSCAASDPSGVAGVQFFVDSTEIPLDGDYFAVCGPFTIGDHVFEIAACDADNSPACSSAEMLFEVYASGPRVIHVSTDGNDTTGTGLLGSPLATIQHGLDTAAGGDTVLVHAGTYYEHDVALVAGVHLMSESGLAECVTIDAQQLGRALVCSYEADSTTMVTGFTVTGGLAEGEGYDKLGGGLFCWWSTLTLSNCSFIDNQATTGGAIDSGNSVLELSGCIFDGNIADGGTAGAVESWCGSLLVDGCTIAGSSAASVGAIYSHMDSVCALRNCQFTGNSSETHSGAVRIYDAPAVVESCAFHHNTAGTDYGALSISTSYQSSIVGCDFIGNSAASRGGALGSHTAPATFVTACTFLENTADFGGAVLCRNQANYAFEECTFARNKATSGGGGMYCVFGSMPTLEGCIIAFSEDSEGILCADAGSVPQLSCCNMFGNAGGDWVGYVADQYGGEDNISADPLFCDTATGDFTLRSDSPCATAACGLMGAYGVGCAAPQVIDASPSPYSVDASTDVVLTVQFSDDVSPTTLQTTSFVVTSNRRCRLEGDIGYSVVTRTASFTPSEDLIPGERFQACVTSDVETSNGDQLVPFSWGFCVATEPSSAMFHEAPSVSPMPTSGNARFASLCGINDDRVLDVVVAVHDPDGLEIYVGNDAPMFMPASVPWTSVGSVPEGVQCFDANGDEYVDMVAVNRDDATATVLLGQAGDTFTEAVGSPYALVPSPRTMAVSDLNVDGFQDLVAPSWTSRAVSVLLGDGAGGLFDAPGTPVVISPCNNIGAVEVDDFNADGIPDLAALEGQLDSTTDPGWIHILLGDGTGTFTEAPDSPCSSVVQRPYDLETGDFDSDGALDLAVLGRWDSLVLIMHGDGTGRLTAGVTTPVATWPRCMTSADVNGDGVLDIVTGSVSAGEVTVLLGDGTGDFSPVSGGPVSVGQEPCSISAGDLSGDGDLDLVVANYWGESISILWNEDEAGTSVETESPVHHDLAILGCRPNPFNPATTISYACPRRESVRLSVRDVSGRHVRTLVDDVSLPGEYEVTWRGVDDSGAAVASGVYFVMLESGDESSTQKLVLLK